MQKTFQPCRNDIIIAKIFLIKKPPNSVKTKEEKSKNIANKKNILSQRVTKQEKLSNNYIGKKSPHLIG